ncbi:unnamed protein product, partial [Protopolystoma xenopodis]
MFPVGPKSRPESSLQTLKECQLFSHSTPLILPPPAGGHLNPSSRERTDDGARRDPVRRQATRPLGQQDGAARSAAATGRRGQPLDQTGRPRPDDLAGRAVGALSARPLPSAPAEGALERRPTHPAPPPRLARPAALPPPGGLEPPAPARRRPTRRDGAGTGTGTGIVRVALSTPPRGAPRRNGDGDGD